ncbi:MAG: SpaA isopeptide-forming pilin-related protein [Acutalibacteraceae bacterium]
MSKQRSSGPHRRILVRLCALALIAAMLLTSAYAGGAVESGSAVESLATENLDVQNTASTQSTQASESTPAKANAPEAEPGESLGAPAHCKYIEDNGDGTYRLSLNVTGKTKVATETERRPVDVLLVVDISNSMDYRINSDENAGRDEDSRMDILERLVTNMADELLPSGTKNRMSIVTFSGSNSTGNRDSSVQRDRGKWQDAKEAQSWTSSSRNITSTISNIQTVGGTNWEAGLYEAKKLLNSRRNDALTFVVFLSDGNPTFRYTTSDYRYGAGYTQGTGTSDDYDNNYNHALAEAEKIPNDIKFFSVSIGGSADRMEVFSNDLSKKGKDTQYFNGKSEDALEDAFNNIIETVTTSGYTNVTISDTLSEYAEFVGIDASGTGITVTRTTKDGQTEPVPEGDYKLNLDPNGKQVSIQWLKMLEDGVTYTISFNIQPSQAAIDRYIQNGCSYPKDMIGETNTGNTSTGQLGFYSNATASLTYNGDGQDKTLLYPKPVIQISTTSIPVEKHWEDSGNTAHRGDSITVELYYKESETPCQTVTLNEKNSWQTQFKNIPVGSEHSFTVKECLNEDQSVYYTSTVEKNESGFTIINTLKVASFTFTKVDADSNDTLLAGAKFELWPAGDDWVKDSNVDKPLYPTYQDNGESTGQDGNATFTDIPFGNYLLYEVKAPAGYKLPTDPVRVTVEVGMVTFYNVEGDKIDEIQLPSGGEGEDSTGEAATIPNKEQDELPVAGGMGAIWFSAGGLALASAAALLYFKQRKKGEE